MFGQSSTSVLKRVHACLVAAAAEGGRPSGPRSKGPSQQRRRLPKAARDQQQAAATGPGLSAESSSASLHTEGPAAQERRAPPGEHTAPG